MKPVIAAYASVPFWIRSKDALCAELHCSPDGLGSADAVARLEQYGPNSDAAPRHTSVAGAILRRLLEPLSLILLAAGIVSVVTGDTIGGSIIVAILTLSIGLDTFQEGRAVKAAEELRRSVALKAEVKRDSVFVHVEIDTVVPGDLIRVRAGDIILGGVGQLQLEVVKHRLKAEYEVEIRYESINVMHARWITRKDGEEVDLQVLTRARPGLVVVDVRGRPVVLFSGDWQLNAALQDLPDYAFAETARGVVMRKD